MNKLTKLLSVFIIAGAVGASVAGVAGCKKKNKGGHTHNYEYLQIEGNDDQHTVHCKNSGHDGGDTQENHEWGGDNVCDKCGYTKTESGDNTPTVTSVTISGADEVTVGSTITLTAAVAGTNNPAQTVTWASADESKATVANGVVTGVAEGTVKITATSTVDNTKVGEKTITVKAAGQENPGDTTPTVTGVTISGEEEVETGKTITLTAAVAGTNNPAQTVTWASADESKATVENGVVTGVAEGTVKITATSTVDNTKVGEKTITVKAAKSVYQILMEREDKLAVLDSKYTVGNKLDAYTDSFTKGIYFRYQSGGSTLATDPARDYIDVIKDGEDLAVQQHGSDGKTNNLPNVYTEIVVGPVSTKLEGYFETKLNKLTSGNATDKGQNPIVFENSGNAELTINALVGALSYKVGDGELTPISGVTLGENAYIKVHFTFDFVSGKTTLELNDVVVMNEVDTGITYIDCIELASSNKGSRQHTTKNIVVCGTTMTAAEFKPVALANLDREYAKYTFEDSLAEDGVTVIKATHSKNKAAVENAYNVGKEAIQAATTFEDIKQEYKEVIENLDYILSDSELEKVWADAIAEFEEVFPASNYTFEGLTGENEGYNNKAEYARIHDEVVAKIKTYTDQMQLNFYLYGSMGMEGILDPTAMDGPFSEIYSNSEAIGEKAYIFNYTVLPDYKADEIAAINAETQADKLAAIQALKQSGVDETNCKTIAEIEEACADILAQIDDYIQQASETPAQTKTRLQGELSAYATTAKTDITDATVTAAIDSAAAAGDTAIGGVDVNAADAQEQAQSAFNSAKAAIDLIVSKHEAK